MFRSTTPYSALECWTQGLERSYSWTQKKDESDFRYSSRSSKGYFTGPFSVEWTSIWPNSTNWGQDI